MRYISKIIACLALTACFANSANAQYYQLANQATGMLQSALQGGANYRGFVDASFIKGIGNKQANFLELSTTHGFKYGNTFFMGLGAGIDLMMTQANENPYRPIAQQGYTKTAAMVPLYTDFRFNFGAPQATGFFIDVRIGGAFYISNDYILVGDGYINNSQSFYLRPSVGMRVPTSKTNQKRAFNIAASYQLLTNSYWYNPGSKNNINLSGLGINVGYEW